MEYRIVTLQDGRAAVFKVAKENGKIHLSPEPEFIAKDVRELQYKIVAINRAFWKPLLTSEKPMV